MNKLWIVQQMEESAGCVVDGTLCYPAINRDGEIDTECQIVSFFANHEDQDPIVEFSLYDMDNAAIIDGSFVIHESTISILEKKDITANG